MVLKILPSGLMDIARTKLFYDRMEEGLGSRFKDYIIGEIDKLPERLCDQHQFGYLYRLAPRFHQCIYYKKTDDAIVVWRVLDTRFDPQRIESALTGTTL